MRKDKIALCACLIVVLCALSACIYQDSAENMALGRTKAATTQLCESLELHRDTTGSLPTKAEGLEALFEGPRPAKNNPVLLDGWKRPLHTVISANLIVGVYSAGLTEETKVVREMTSAAKLKRAGKQADCLT